MDNKNVKKHYTYLKGKIYTANKNNDFVEGVIIEGNRIIYSGSRQTCEELISKRNISQENLNIVSLKEGQVGMPGFYDSHIHPYVATKKELGLDLSKCSTLEEVTKAISHYISNHQAESWIIGSGYGDHIFSESNPISYKILDSICREKPVVINRYDCHAMWLNSKAIETIKITKDTPNPEAGVIEKDENGNLTGVLHDSAMCLIKDFAPVMDKSESEKIMKATIDNLVSLGIVGFMDAAVRGNFKVYKDFYEKNQDKSLPRCALSMCIIPIFFDPDPNDEEPNQNESLFEAGLRTLDNFFKNNRIKDWKSLKSGEYRLKVNTVKVFLDGVFESGTALYTCSCHSGDSQNEDKKPLTYTQEDLVKICKYFVNNGIQMHCHAIGDLATSNYLAALEEVLKNENSGDKLREMKNYLAHMQKVNKQDFSRMINLHLSANYSPYWFKEDSFTAKFKELIGKDGLKDVYPVKSMLDSGIPVCFGSDWPVSTPNPLDGIEVAVTHKELGVESGDENDCYNPGQNLTLYEALKAYMSGSAYVLGLGEECGVIEEGRLADIIVLDKDIFNIKPSLIHTAKVTMTMIDGDIIYSI